MRANETSAQQRARNAQFLFSYARSIPCLREQRQASAQANRMYNWLLETYCRKWACDGQVSHPGKILEGKRVKQAWQAYFEGMLLHNQCPDCSDKYTSSRHDKQESNHYTGSATERTLISVNLIARNSFFDLFLNYSGTSSTGSRLLWTQVNMDKGLPSVSRSSHKLFYKWLTLL